MSLGILFFGMTPFGWRFMGTLFGVLMLPILYIFLKNLFGKRAVATCGTILFAVDFMHLTQTRIGTIDTYGVFYILLMYYFLYRWLTLAPGTPFRRCALPLFLSGLFWGIGAASKWTVIYGAVGLAVLYFIGLFSKLRDWPAEATGKLPWLWKTLAFSVLSSTPSPTGPMPLPGATTPGCGASWPRSSPGPSPSCPRSSAASGSSSSRTARMWWTSCSRTSTLC